MLCIPKADAVRHLSSSLIASLFVTLLISDCFRRALSDVLKKLSKDPFSES